jgi:hypothetical protein
MSTTPPVGANPVTGAIRKAAQATGVGFDYLLATAKVESDLDPNLTMRSSTATGLFQFIEQTWLGTLKQAGPALGYGNYADAISRTPSGSYVVEDPTLRREIMQLRKDPTANAMMGGVFTQQNAAVLSSRLGRAPSEGELYIGHFFGPYAGAKALALAASNPNAKAAEIFPAAAQANRSIFYDGRGNARSVAGVCAELARRYQVARAESAPPAVAVNATPPPPRPPASIPTAAASVPPLVPPVPPVSPVSASIGLNDLMFTPAPIPAAIGFAADDTNAPAAVPDTSAIPPARTDTAGGMFHSLFQTGERREAVSPAISQLWGSQPPAKAPPASLLVTDVSRDKSAGDGFMLDLFRDQGTSLRRR